MVFASVHGRTSPDLQALEVLCEACSLHPETPLTGFVGVRPWPPEAEMSDFERHSDSSCFGL